MASSDTRLQVRLGEGLHAWLTDRAARYASPSRHEHGRAELGMWRDVMAAELRRIRLTLPQARCIAQVIDGPLLTPGVPARLGMVYAEVYDAFRIFEDSPTNDDEAFPLDEDGRKELLDYLGRLGPAADMALYDAFSRWWASGGKATVEGFAKVGLTVIAS